VIVPCPDRIRCIGKSGFGWLDGGLHREGWLEVLTTEEVAIYAFLCLVADRQGVSWYRRRRIGDALGIPEAEVRAALKRLCELDLLAYAPFRRGAADGFHQVLSLPAGGPPSLMDQLAQHVAQPA
jgi:hypothetical protein